MTERRGEMIVGPMFSGKTTELLRRVQRAIVSGRDVLVVRPSLDDRASGNVIATHTPPIGSPDELVHHRNYRVVTLDHLRDVTAVDSYDHVSLIAIDEGQFFDDLDYVSTLLEAKSVIIAALDGAYDRTPFTNVLNLIAVCDSVTKLLAICRVCGRDAPFTACIDPPAVGVIKVSHSSRDYVAMCRECHRVCSA